MSKISDLAGKIRLIGFRCKQCGTCCRCGETDSNLVMVFPDEIRSIISACGRSWNSVAQPYPETIDHQNGARYTLGWCLRRENDHCHFLKENLCAIYEQRPWICRTYPFFLEDNELKVSRCEGLGQMISEQDATMIAFHLLQRHRAEEEEEQRVRQVLQQTQIPSGACVVIDSEGVRVIDG
jgi:uncharacterized protein